MPRKLLPALVACGAILAVPAAPASAAEIVVNTTADLPVETTPDTTCDAGGGQCTLREAIRTANVLGGPDVVTVPPGTYVLTQTGTTENAARFGDLDLVGQITINGTAGARSTVIDGNGTDRVFEVQGMTTDTTIQGVTIRDGSVQDAGGGGGVLNFGGLTIAETAIVENVATSQPGGGINNGGTATLTLRRSLVTGHETSGQGAGINNSGNLTIENSTFSDNHTSASGGALFSTGSTNSVQVNYATFAGNTAAGNSAAIHVAGPAAAGIRNSIVADSDPCFGAVTSSGYNIAQNGGCTFTAPGDQIADPQLGALGDNGGPTDTHMIAPTSPARDAADPGNCLPTDQRGANRPAGPRCDIGAVEWYPAPPQPRVAVPAFLALDPAQAERRPGDPNVITATARNDDGTPAAGRTIRYSIVGPNDGAGTATTDANGVARIEWDGIREGTDTINAYIDTNGNETPDATEPLASAQVTWALPPPRAGRTMNIEPVSGIVRISTRTRRRGKNGASAAGARVQRLTEAKQVSIATTTVDVRQGRVQMSTIADRRTSNIQKGEFYGGVYQTAQSTRSRRPYTDLRLTESLICQSNRRGKLVPARARSRRLWGNARGRFRTRGRHSVATVRGTIWLQKDTCRSTTTLVRQGTVIVRDLAKRKNVRIKRGRRYVARARARR